MGHGFFQSLSFHGTLSVTVVMIKNSIVTTIRKNLFLFMKLLQDTIANLDIATQTLKETFGEDPDMWAKETRIR